MLQEIYRLHRKRLPGLNPVSFGRQQCEPDFEVSVPRPYWLLHFVVSGKGFFTANNKTYEVHTSQIFIIRPHQVHTYRAHSQNPWQYIWLAFYADGEIPPILDADVITAPACARIFLESMEAAKLDVGQEEFLAAKLWELFSLLLRHTESTLPKQSAYILAAQRYIEQNYMADISVTDIANQLHLDRCYFSTLFHKQIGISPQQYLLKCRMEKAAHLLAAEGTTVASAAAEVGYNDSINFTRMFKKHFGVPPSKYREMIFAETSHF